MQYMKTSKALELLNQGFTLVTPGSNLDRLEKKGDDSYYWKGMKDKAPTILTKREVEGLIPNRKWDTL
jgi:hypothetical protein